MSETSTSQAPEGRPVDSPVGWVSDHIRRYVETDGADGHIWNGVPTLLLTTKGRKSGQPRRTALIYAQDGDDVLIVASKGGAPEHPLWYTNLEADPQVEVQVGADRYAATAHTASEDEKARLWPKAVAVWPAYEEYQTKTDRPIPVVVLSRS